MRRISTVTAWLGTPSTCGHLVLDLGRVLGGGVDGDVVVLAAARRGRPGPRGRSAPARRSRCGPPARAAPRRWPPRRRRAPWCRAAPAATWPPAPASMVRIAGRSSYSTTARRAAARACADGLGGHGEQRLAPVFDQPVGEHRVVAGDGAHIVDARHVLGRQHDDDARRRPHRGDVERRDGGVRPLALGDVDVQRARRLGDVVDVDRLARHVLGAAVVAARRADAAVITDRERARASGRRAARRLRRAKRRLNAARGERIGDGLRCARLDLRDRRLTRTPLLGRRGGSPATGAPSRGNT